MPEITAESPFRTWNGRDSWEFVDGGRIHAIGGEQVLLCRVQYEPGKQVPWHAHEDTEQVMFVLDGEVEMTIEEETQTLRKGDVVVVNRGLHHKLYSEGGVTFMEALAPVPLDHVPDKSLDLVLGPDGGAQHVERGTRTRAALRLNLEVVSARNARTHRTDANVAY